MSESAFLSAVEDFLRNAGLTPAPALLGIAEPSDDDELPAVTLSLEALERPRSGLGERTTLITDGALPRQVTIDLTDSTLPGVPGVEPLDEDRTTLTLPHGGLVRSDGTEGALGPGDLTVSVAGDDRAVVTGEPGSNEVRAVPEAGQLRFGSPLPDVGNVEVGYFLRQWEQRVSRLVGTLRVDVSAASAGDAATLSRAVLDALDGARPRAAARVTGDTLKGLLSLSVKEVGSVGVADLPTAGNGNGTRYRRRTHRLAFGWERIVDEPESSGGIIGRVQVESEVDGAGAERMTVQ